jgi:hypothetical protein
MIITSLFFILVLLSIIQNVEISKTNYSTIYADSYSYDCYHET